jgi:hypothetical protein
MKSKYDYGNQLFMVACLTLCVSFIPLTIWKINKEDPKKNKTYKRKYGHLFDGLVY